MADNNRKSQAEKAASAAAKNKKTVKKTGNNAKSSKTVTNPEMTGERDIPVRLITSILFFVLFALFLVVSFYPEGALIKLIRDVACGLLGQVGFYVSIPVLLYLFYIHAFSGKRPVRMRTVCLFLFVVCCGCIAHLALDPVHLPSGMPLLSELYIGGVDGTTSGLLCGGLCMIVHWLCGMIILFCRRFQVCMVCRQRMRFAVFRR